MNDDTKNALAFTGVSVLLSWLLAGVFLMFGGSASTKGMSAVSVLYVLVPGIVAIAMQKWVYGAPAKTGLSMYFKPNRWFFAAILLAMVIALAVNEVGLMLPWNEYSPEMSGFFDYLAKTSGPDTAERTRSAVDMMPIPFFWLMFVQGLIGGATIGAVFAFFEETGFRGFLLERLKGLGFWTMALITGLAWGVWAAPSVLLKHNFLMHPAAGIGAMLLFCLLASPLYLFFRLKSGSVMGGAIFGGTLHGLAAIPMLMVEEQNNLTVGLEGLPGFIVLAAAVLLMVGFDRMISDSPVTVRKETESDGTALSG